MPTSEPVQIYASTACIPGTVSLRTRAADYRAEGLDNVELGAGVNLEHMSISEIPGLSPRMLVHNYFPPPADPFVLNLASENAEIREKSLDLVFRALELSARLSAPFYSVHAGFITDPTSFGTTSFVFPMPGSPQDANRALRRFIDMLERCLNRAAELGVMLLIENNVCSRELKGKLLLQNTEEFTALFEAVHDPHLGVLFDTGHLNVTSRTLGFDRWDFVTRIAPHIRAFHVHDNDGSADTHTPIRPGSWVLDVLRREEFSTLPVIVEAKFRTVTELRDHIDWLDHELTQSSFPSKTTL